MYIVSDFKIHVKLKSGIYTSTKNNPEIGSEYECEGVIQKVYIDNGDYSNKHINEILYSCITDYGSNINFFRTIVVLWANGIKNTYGDNELILCSYRRIDYKSIW